MPTTQQDFDALEIALRNNKIEDIRRILLNFDVTAIDSCDWNCLTLACRFSSSPEVMKLVFEKIVGEKDLLKSQLTATNNSGQTCLMIACNNSSSSEVVKLLAVVLFYVELFTIQYEKLDDYDKHRLKEKTGIDSSSWTPDAATLAEVKAILQGADPAAAKKKPEANGDPNVRTALVTALKNNKIEDLKRILQNFDVTKTNCLMLCCESNSPEVMELILGKIFEVGGIPLLKSQLTATDHNKQTCLMICCRNSLSPEVVKVLIEKIVKMCGQDVLKSQLSATGFDGDHGWTSLMLACRHSSLEVVKLVFEKIVEVGGAALLKNQLSATTNNGLTCLKIACNYSSSPEVVKLVFEKINAAGGPALLKNQLTVTAFNRWNTPTSSTCLMETCRNSSSPEIVKLVFEKVIQAGGPELLKSQLTATSKQGRNFLMVCCSSSTTEVEVMKVFLQRIVQAGGPELLKSQFTATDDGALSCLMIACNFSKSAEVKLLAVVLFHLDLFKMQYEKLDYACKNKFTEMTGIDSSSWSPDDKRLAEVKAILEGGDAADDKKKKAEEEAALVKKNGEEKSAAAKKKAEEEAAAKKKAAEQAAAKKKVELLLFSIPRIQKSALDLDLNTPIGSGATCSVYSCSYSGTECAAKIFHSHITSDKALQREMNAAVHLRHPNIVNVLVIIVDDTDKSKIIGILMQRMNGTLLQRATNTSPFEKVSSPTILELIKWCSQTASAILCAHSLKCIHCDIKPENVMLDRHGNAHLTDFGSAHVMSTAATKVTSVRGTALYIAPEYAAGDIDGPNESTDVFSFGMLMWSVFHPKEDHGMGKNEIQIGRSLDRGKRPEINGTTVPAEVVALIEKCWHEDADERPAMAEILTVFNEVIARIEESEKAASSVFKLTPSPLWTDARYLKTKHGAIADHLTSLKWNTRADAPSLHFSEDITDKNSPLFKFIEQKFRPSPGFKQEEQIYSDVHFSGKFSRLQMVQPADAHSLFLALHEADGSSRSANSVLRRKNNTDPATHNAIEKLESIFEDPEVNPTTNNANFSRILFGWHGTNASIAEKICRDGPRSLRTTDAGFFGAGSYFSLEADYAAQYAYMCNTNAKEENAIILFAVSLSETYPITLEHDYRSKEDANRPDMHGFSNFYNGPDPKKAIALAPKCDSHFVPVKKHGDGRQHPLGKYDVVNGNAVVEKDKTKVALNLDQQACNAKDPEVFGHEIVVGNHQRAVAVAILYFR